MTQIASLGFSEYGSRGLALAAGTAYASGPFTAPFDGTIPSLNCGTLKTSTGPVVLALYADGGAGQGCTLLTAVSGGALVLAGTTIANPGINYSVGSLILVSGGGAGGIFQVTQVDVNGSVTNIALFAGGSGYSASSTTPVTTTCLPTPTGAPLCTTATAGTAISTSGVYNAIPIATVGGVSGTSYSVTAGQKYWVAIITSGTGLSLAEASGILRLPYYNYYNTAASSGLTLPSTGWGATSRDGGYALALWAPITVGNVVQTPDAANSFGAPLVWCPNGGTGLTVNIPSIDTVSYASGQGYGTLGGLPTIAAGGAGYSLNELVQVVQGSAYDGILQVTGVGANGVATSLAIYQRGHGYAVATGTPVATQSLARGAMANHRGPYRIEAFTGSTRYGVMVDLTNEIGLPSTSAPIIGFQLDNGPFTALNQLIPPVNGIGGTVDSIPTVGDGLTLLNIAPEGTLDSGSEHQCIIYYASSVSGAGGSRWGNPPSQGVQVKYSILDSGGSFVAPTLKSSNVLLYGDSISGAKYDRIQGGQGCTLNLVTSGGSLSSATIATRGTRYTLGQRISPTGMNGAGGYFLVSGVDINGGVTAVTLGNVAGLVSSLTGSAGANYPASPTNPCQTKILDELHGTDAACGFAFLLRNALDAEIGIVAYDGQGFSCGGDGSVPQLIKDGDASANWANSAWPWYYSGKSMLNSSGQFPVALNQVWIVHGVNDFIVGGPASNSTVQTLALDWIGAVHAAAPTAQIVVVVPFGGYYRAALGAAVASAVAAGINASLYDLSWPHFVVNLFFVNTWNPGDSITLTLGGTPWTHTVGASGRTAVQMASDVAASTPPAGYAFSSSNGLVTLAPITPASFTGTLAITSSTGTITQGIAGQTVTVNQASGATPLQLSGMYDAVFSGPNNLQTQDTIEGIHPDFPGHALIATLLGQQAQTVAVQQNAAYIARGHVILGTSGTLPTGFAG